MIWLGVDGGGTKTACCLIDHGGNVLARTVAPGTYYLADGLEVVRGVLEQAIAAVCDEAGVDRSEVDHAFLGVPGYGEVSTDVAALDALAAGVLPAYTCGNDMVCAWAGSLGGADGVNVIAGTGSMTYGERVGLGVRVGGWGEVFGDEGSAHWIGVEGLRAASHMSDGRADRGLLLDVLMGHLELTVESDLVDVVLNRWRGNRARVAGLALQVGVAADRGDAVAAGILARAGRELALLVATTRARLGWPAGEPAPVSWSGGVFASERVRAGFRTALDAAEGAYDLREPLFPPVVGAALHAARLAGHPLTAPALDRLRAAL